MAWRNVGEDREKDSRVMAGARLRAKGDTVAAKMKVGGGGLGEGKEEDRKRRQRHRVKFDELQTGVKMKRRALAEGAEEIQMEIEARRKREEVVAREREEIAGEESLACALETFEGKKQAERKRREIREEEEEKWEWEREKQMRERLVEAERVKKQGQAAIERKGGDKQGKRGVDTSDIGRQDWRSTRGSKTDGIGRAEREASD